MKMDDGSGSAPTHTEERITPDADGGVGGMTKAQLLAECGKRGVSVKPNATKAELVAALFDLEADAPKADEPVEVPLTIEEARRLQGANDETIQRLLDSGKAEQWRPHFERELAHRASVRAEAEALKARQSEIKRWRVVKGGTYYGRDFFTALAAGSVVTEHSHDLADLERQGFILEPTGTPRVVYDQLGVPKTAF